MDTDINPLRAVIFEANALAEFDRDGHRVACNAAFIAHGLGVNWSIEEYRRLQPISGDRQRIATALRAHGFGGSSEVLAAEVFDTKTEMFDDWVLDGDVAPRAGLIDLVMSLFVAGIWVGVVSIGRRGLVAPLVRQLVGDGLVETLVTADDVTQPERPGELYSLALWELGISADSALGIESTGWGFHAAVAAGLPTMVVTTGYTPGQEFAGAVAVRPDYNLPEPLLAANCRELHRRWCIQQKRSEVS